MPETVGAAEETTQPICRPPPKKYPLGNQRHDPEDVKLLSHQQFPDSEKGFREFKYWEVYLEVENSPKFMAGVESGWPKRTKINASGEYNSSAGSHELRVSDPSIVFPPPSPGWEKDRDADG